jgi:hypothetical protein
MPLQLFSLLVKSDILPAEQRYLKNKWATVYDNDYYPMAEKITPEELEARRDEYVIVDVREADELEEEGKIDGAVNMPLG